MKDLDPLNCLVWGGVVVISVLFWTGVACLIGRFF